MKGDKATKGTKRKGMKAQKADMKGHESTKRQNESKWSHKRLKWKKIKAQKADMKADEGTKHENERR